MAVTDTTIRFATSADATTIFNFIQALAIYEREPDAVEATPASISNQLDSERPPFECLWPREEKDLQALAFFFITI